MLGVQIKPGGSAHLQGRVNENQHLNPSMVDGRKVLGDMHRKTANLAEKGETEIMIYEFLCCSHSYPYLDCLCLPSMWDLYQTF